LPGPDHKYGPLLLRPIATFIGLKLLPKLAIA
jgi:hypothetical protein